MPPPSIPSLVHLPLVETDVRCGGFRDLVVDIRERERLLEDVMKWIVAASFLSLFESRWKKTLVLISEVVIPEDPSDDQIKELRLSLPSQWPTTIKNFNRWVATRDAANRALRNLDAAVQALPVGGINWHAASDGRTPLIVAAQFGVVSVVDVLLKREDLDVNVQKCDTGEAHWLSATPAAAVPETRIADFLVPYREAERAAAEAEGILVVFQNVDIVPWRWTLFMEGRNLAPVHVAAFYLHRAVAVKLLDRGAYLGDVVALPTKYLNPNAVGYPYLEARGMRVTVGNDDVTEENKIAFEMRVGQLVEYSASPNPGPAPETVAQAEFAYGIADLEEAREQHEALMSQYNAGRLLSVTFTVWKLAGGLLGSAVLTSDVDKMKFGRKLFDKYRAQAETPGADQRTRMLAASVSSTQLMTHVEVRQNPPLVWRSRAVGDDGAERVRSSLFFWAVTRLNTVAVDAYRDPTFGGVLTPGERAVALEAADDQVAKAFKVFQLLTSFPDARLGASLGPDQPNRPLYYHGDVERFRVTALEQAIRICHVGAVRLLLFVAQANDSPGGARALASAAAGYVRQQGEIVSEGNMISVATEMLNLYGTGPMDTERYEMLRIIDLLQNGPQSEFWEDPYRNLIPHPRDKYLTPSEARRSELGS